MMLSMFSSCSACRNRYNKNRRDLQFYPFPFQQHLCRKWCTAIGRKNWNPTLSSCLCSEHFLPGDFYPPTPISNVKKLKPNAVPSKFLSSSYPSTKLEEPTRKRKVNLKEKVKSHSKPNEVINNTATLKSTDELNEEMPDIKPDVHSLVIATNYSASDHSEDTKQYENDKTSYKSDKHETSVTDSDTDTASETEEISFSDIIIHSVSSCARKENSEEILEQNLENIESHPKPKEAIDNTITLKAADKSIDGVLDIKSDILALNVSPTLVHSDEATQLKKDMIACCAQNEHQQSDVNLKSSDKLCEDIPDIKPDIHMLNVRSTFVHSDEVIQHKDDIVAYAQNKHQQSDVNLKSSDKLCEDIPDIKPDIHMLNVRSTFVHSDEVIQHKDDVVAYAQNKHQESDVTLKSTNTLNEEILDIKPDIHILCVNSALVHSDEKSQHLDVSTAYHKNNKHPESYLTSESTDESHEEILDIKPDIYILNSSVVHSDEKIQYKDYTPHYENNKHQESEAGSDTETSSEAEEIMFSEMKLYSDFSSSLNKNSEDILKRKLENMIVRYEKTREKMELYREKWKLCLEQVTALEEIIDNLKTNNSINDSS